MARYAYRAKVPMSLEREDMELLFPRYFSIPVVLKPTETWALDAPADRMDAACRAAGTPLIGRIERDRFLVDFRTLAPGDEEETAAAVVSLALEDLRDAEARP